MEKGHHSVRKRSFGFVEGVKEDDGLPTCIELNECDTMEGSDMCKPYGDLVFVQHLDSCIDVLCIHSDQYVFMFRVHSV